MGFKDLGKTYSDVSNPNEAAITNWCMAAIMAAGTGFVAWHMSWPVVLDINDPDFNPIVVVLLAPLGATVWHTVKAVRWTARGRRFGAAIMEIDGPVPAPLGRRLSGRVRIERSPAPTGDYRIRLRCFDIHEMRRSSDAGMPYGNEEFPVWSEEITLPASNDAAKGLPFAFQLPASAGPKIINYADRSERRYFEFKFAITIPGLRKIYTKNSPPIGRRWELDVSAPTKGADYRAAFCVPVLEE
ncbi:MAG: hypothetical protein ACK4MV_11205 [Beijerinckiaceae bacterium]